MKFSTYVTSTISDKIQSEANNKTIGSRSISTRSFLKYLSSEEEKEIKNIVIDQTKFETHFGKIFPQIMDEIDGTLKNIETHTHIRG